MITTLDKLHEGEIAVVCDFRGGHGLRQRLESMGLHPGDKIKVMRIASMGGPVLVEVHGTLVGIGRGMAMKIEVDTNGNKQQKDTNCPCRSTQ